MKTKDKGARTELLSPAGSFECACAAFAFGADAVYLGLSSHSARAEAVNFTPGELASICAYAHRLAPRRAVYVALNTLVRDVELGGILDSLSAIDEAGADGIIVQDLAVAALARDHFPSIPRHASTQLFIHNAEGAIAARELGFSRVVLARELTFGEIEEINRLSGIETEVFIQGALCYGYSGQCLFSAIATGRSGNRGQCAYCCRGRFTSMDGAHSAFPFSMRDLSLGEAVLRLRDAGIASLKIEGRMKSPLYVAAATRLYRMILDGEASPRAIAAAREDLLTVFSRPSTTLYFNGAGAPREIIDPETVGHRGCPVGAIESIGGGRSGRFIRIVPERPIELHDGLQIDLPGRPYGFAVESLRTPATGRTVPMVEAGAAVEIALPRDAPRLPHGAEVFCASSQATRRRLSYDRPRAADLTPARPVGVEVTLARDSVSARASFGGMEASASLPAQLGPAKNPGMTGQAVERAFSRMGASGWSAVSMAIHDPDALFAPASLMNELRRSLSAALDARRAENAALRLGKAKAAIAVAPPQDDLSVPHGESFRVRLSAKPTPLPCAETVLAISREDCRATDRLAAAVAEWRRHTSQIRIALPLVVRDNDLHAVEKAVKGLAGIGITAWEVGELSMLRLLRRTCGNGVSVVAAPSLYALNAMAAAELRALGVAAAVLPAEADAQDAASLCERAPCFFIPCAESRPAMFVSETAPVVDWETGCGYMLKDARGATYTVEKYDGLWLTRPAEPRRIAVPPSAIRVRRDYF